MDTNYKPKWQCPSCKEWVKERLDKKCLKCRQDHALERLKHINSLE